MKYYNIIEMLCSRKGVHKQPNPLIYYSFIYLVLTIVVGHLAYQYHYFYHFHYLGVLAFEYYLLCKYLILYYFLIEIQRNTRKQKNKNKTTNAIRKLQQKTIDEPEQKKCIVNGWNKMHCALFRRGASSLLPRAIVG